MNIETPEVQLQDRINELERQLAESRRQAQSLALQNHSLLGLHQATLKLTSRHELPALMREIVAHLTHMFDAAEVYAARHLEATDEFEILIGSGAFTRLVGKVSQASPGLAGQVFRSGTLGCVNNYPAWSGRNPDPCWDFIQALAIAPVTCAGRVVGILGLAYSDPGRPIEQPVLEALDQFAQSASLAVDRAVSQENIQQLGNELKSLYEITLDMTSLLDTGHVLNVIIDRAARLAGATSGFVFLMKPKCDYMECMIGLGLYADAIGYQLQPGMGLAGKVWQSAEHMVVNDYQTWEGRHPDHKWDPIQSIAGIPLKYKDRVIGVIGLMHTEPGRIFRETDIRVLNKLAEMATLSLNNARLFEEIAELKTALVKTLEDTIQAVAYTVEIRDPYTAGHQRRVSILARAIAKKMNLAPEQIKGVEMGAIIHDIGKLYVPSEFLSKPTRLADIEFDVIKYHASAGYEILKGIQFPWPIAEVAHQHHEKMDGTGYPRGLKGEEIIIEARIVAVADVVEAISSHRPYRPSLGYDRAIHEIRSKRGTEFDPAVVDACLDVLREGIDLDGPWR